MEIKSNILLTYYKNHELRIYNFENDLGNILRN